MLGRHRRHTFVLGQSRCHAFVLERNRSTCLGAGALPEWSKRTPMSSCLRAETKPLSRLCAGTQSSPRLCAGTQYYHKWIHALGWYCYKWIHALGWYYLCINKSMLYAGTTIHKWIHALDWYYCWLPCFMLVPFLNRNETTFKSML